MALRREEKNEQTQHTGQK